MENNNELNKFLSDKMSIDDLDISVPELSSAVRNKITERKKQSLEIEDFFSLVAAFLNFKIKLYHAITAIVVIGGCILYFSGEERSDRSDAHSGDHISNIASVKSSTVLSSIHTFALTKEQAYANRTN
jgi:ubiquinone biosynthesis protein COQ9